MGLRGRTESTVRELTELVAAKLRDLPIEVYYGRERFGRQWVNGNRIQVEEVGADAWGPPAGTRDGVEPPVGSCKVAVQILIEGRSDRAGATEDDHKLLTRQMADLAFALFVEEAMSWGTAEENAYGRAQPIVDWAATGGFTERPEDEVEVGARYVMSLRVSRSVPLAKVMLSVLGSTLNATDGGVVTVTQQDVEQVVVIGEE